MPKIASTISVQSLTSEKCSSHAWLSATLDDGEAEPAEDLEVDPRVAAHVGDAADEKHRDVDAALHQRPRDDEAVAAVVAAAAEHGDAALARDRAYIASIAATTWRPAFSISTSDGMPMSSIGAAVGFAHLRGVENSHEDRRDRVGVRLQPDVQLRAE